MALSNNVITMIANYFMIRSSEHIFTSLNSFTSIQCFLCKLCAASMGVSEGKSVGEWFGPNTVAQVLR